VGTGAVDVTVTNHEGMSVTWSGDRFAYVAAPTVRTRSAAFVTQPPIRLDATVNPNGGTRSNGLGLSDCHFEYGTTSSYGFNVPCGTLPEGLGPEFVIAWLEHPLSANTTYHYRIVATNPIGTRYGADETFTTLP